MQLVWQGVARCVFNCPVLQTRLKGSLIHMFADGKRLALALHSFLTGNNKVNLAIQAFLQSPVDMPRASGAENAADIALSLMHQLRLQPSSSIDFDPMIYWPSSPKIRCIFTTHILIS